MLPPRHLFTVEDAAERLNLHVKTVRRYIHEGKLKAKRIGKEYRITRSDLAEFGGESAPAEETLRTRHVLVSTIVDVDAISVDESQRVTTMVMAGMSARKGEADHPRVDCVYYREVARLRITITGSLELTTSLLRVIDALLQDGREASPRM